MAKAKDTHHPTPTAPDRATNIPCHNPGRYAPILRPHAPTIVSIIKIITEAQDRIRRPREATTAEAPHQAGVIAVRHVAAARPRGATPAPHAHREEVAVPAAAIRLLHAHRVVVAQGVALEAVRMAVPQEVVAEAAKLKILFY